MSVDSTRDCNGLNMTCLTEYPELYPLARASCRVSNLKPFPEFSVIPPRNVHFDCATLKVWF